MLEYIYKTLPFKHQRDIFEMSRDREAFALLLEMGCGKTKIAIDTAAWLYATGQIGGVLVVAPNGVHQNWVDNEVPTHMPDYIPFKAAIYRSQPTKSEAAALKATLEYDDLKIVAMNVEAFATKKGIEFADQFLNAIPSIMIVDESSTIKSPKALRTKAILKLGRKAKFRRIMTGTPITQSPLDLYTQFAFLDPTILRCSSYYAFRNRYAIMREMKTGGRSFMVVQGYCNLDELTKLITPHSARVTKAECLDLPDKLYQKRYVELSAKQKQLYEALRRNLIAEFAGKQVVATIALTKLLRLQQIIGGFVAFEDGSLEAIDDRNPRLTALVETLEEVQGKVIIWARFRNEIKIITDMVSSIYGPAAVVEYHGGIDNATRADAVARFQNDPSVRFFVGHVQAGGKGLTLHAATTVIYYSNDFSLENRLQSEDRAHRIGQQHAVTYIDLVAPRTIDERLVQCLRTKKELADQITGDELRNWI